jgi:hypothetical protein
VGADLDAVLVLVEHGGHVLVAADLPARLQREAFVVDADEVRGDADRCSVDVAVVPQVDVDELCDLPGAVGQLRYRRPRRHRLEGLHRSIGLVDVVVVPAQELLPVGDHERDPVHRDVAEVLLEPERVPVEQHVVRPRQRCDRDIPAGPCEYGHRRQPVVGPAAPHPERPMIDADEAGGQHRSHRLRVTPDGVNEALDERKE